MGMKAIMHKSGAILMSLLLLFSTLSFTVDMHFCGHSLVDVKLFQKAEDCGMAMSSDAMKALGCCSDVEIQVDGRQDLEQLVSTVEIAPLATVFQLSYFQLLYPLEFQHAEQTTFLSDSPPRPGPDLQITYQQFLI